MSKINLTLPVYRITTANIPYQTVLQRRSRALSSRAWRIWQPQRPLVLLCLQLHHPHQLAPHDRINKPDLKLPLLDRPTASNDEHSLTLNNSDPHNSRANTTFLPIVLIRTDLLGRLHLLRSLLKGHGQGHQARPPRIMRIDQVRLVHLGRGLQLPRIRDRRLHPQRRCQVWIHCWRCRMRTYMLFPLAHSRPSYMR